MELLRKLATDREIQSIIMLVFVRVLVLQALDRRQEQILDAHDSRDAVLVLAGDRREGHILRGGVAALCHCQRLSCP